MVGALQMADVSAQVALSMHHDFTGFAAFTPGPHRIPALDLVVDQLVVWLTASATLRTPVA